MLIDYGACTDIKDFNGLRPVDLARGRIRCEQTLEDAKAKNLIPLPARSETEQWTAQGIIKSCQTCNGTCHACFYYSQNFINVYTKTQNSFTYCINDCHPSIVTFLPGGLIFVNRHSFIGTCLVHTGSYTWDIQQLNLCMTLVYMYIPYNIIILVRGKFSYELHACRYARIKLTENLSNQKFHEPWRHNMQ